MKRRRSNPAPCKWDRVRIAATWCSDPTPREAIFHEQRKSMAEIAAEADLPIDQVREIVTELVRAQQ